MIVDIERKYPIGREVTVQEDGHVEKHIVRGYIVKENEIYIELDPGGRFNLKRLEEMEIREKDPETVASILADVAQKLCDHYCKYPGSCSTDEELHDRCAECPVTRRFGVV